VLTSRRYEAIDVMIRDGSGKEWSEGESYVLWLTFAFNSLPVNSFLEAYSL